MKISCFNTYTGCPLFYINIQGEKQKDSRPLVARATLKRERQSVAIGYRQRTEYYSATVRNLRNPSAKQTEQP